MQKLYGILLLGFFATRLVAQGGNPCFTLPEMQIQIKKRMLENRIMWQNKAISIPPTPVYIPVRLWLTANSDGSDRYVKFLELFQFFCTTNECIGNKSIQFYIKEINENLDNSLVHKDPLGQGLQLIVDSTKLRQDAINIFLTDFIHPTAGAIFLFNHDFILLDDHFVQKESGILCHELGHYFSLPHTSGDWFDYQCNIPTLDQRKGMVLPEYVSRTKVDINGIQICNYAGDGFCDTDADYGEVMNPNTPCSYTGCAKDPDLVNLNPDLSNPMTIGSYITCFDSFSTQQRQAILFDFLSPHRDYIKTIYTPKGEVIEPKYLAPLDKHQFVRNDSLKFDWEDAPNATDYILEIAQNINFTLNLLQFKTTQSEYLVRNLSPKKVFYWRVLAYNSNSYCLKEPQVSIFTTGALTTIIDNDFHQNYNFTILNLSNSNILRIKFATTWNHSILFSLFDLSGSLVLKKTIANQEIDIDRSNLIPGIYIFKFITPEHKMVYSKLLLN